MSQNKQATTNLTSQFTRKLKRKKRDVWNIKTHRKRNKDDECCKDWTALKCSLANTSNIKSSTGELTENTNKPIKNNFPADFSSLHLEMIPQEKRKSPVTYMK